MGAFDPAFEDLPSVVPIFPLPSALLLPGGHLPLRLFEPRYLAMFDHALAQQRIIGMIQPRDEEADFASSTLYGTGCLGRITAFSETDEGHYMVTLTGLCRFSAGEEREPVAGYRRLAIDCSPFRSDLAAPERGSAALEPLSASMLADVRRYFEAKGYDADWKSLETAPRHQITTTLSMLCPFDPVEKQALIEAASHEERLKILLGLMKMDQMAASGGSSELN